MSLGEYQITAGCLFGGRRSGPGVVCRMDKTAGSWIGVLGSEVAVSTANGSNQRRRLPGATVPPLAAVNLVLVSPSSRHSGKIK